MKLQQLRFLKAIADNQLNITLAAEKLFTSQPGVSKQIRLLEEELGTTLFQRSGKHLTHITPAGRQVLQRAERILQEVDNIRAVANDFVDDERGELRIATTHTQARYVLPRVLAGFRQRYPQVRLTLEQGTPPQIARMAALGEVDLAIATEAMAQYRELLVLPAYRWRQGVVVPHDHPLAKDGTELSLQRIADFPLVSYVHGFTGRQRLENDFRQAGVEPHFTLSASDSDVIKTYVRLGLGVGIIAHMAYEIEKDSDLTYLDCRHLFSFNVTKVGFRRGAWLRGYTFDFLARLAGHFDARRIDQAAHADSQDEVDALFATLELPEL